MIRILNIAVLLTCHNRKNKTVECLYALHAQQGLNINYNLEVFLVDDNSTDGTAKQITVQFPKVKIINGNGNLYWNRGMYLAWKTASAEKNFDYYLWLNDDTFLFSNALNLLLLAKSENNIIAGATKSINSQLVTYGGFANTNLQLVPNGGLQECNHINGNCVLIPKAVFNLLGNLDPIFHHALGDFDYGLRARKQGIKLLLTSDFVGTCETHSTIPQWRSTSVNILKRFKFLYSPTSGCHPPQYFVFDKRHNGLGIAVLHFISIHLRAVMPGLWKV